MICKIGKRIRVIRSECLKNNRCFEFSRFGFSSAVVYRPLDSQAVRECLINPEKFFRNGKIVKDSRTTKAALTELSDGKKVFLKKYNNKGFVYSLKYLLRKARAYRAWSNGWTLEACHIPTPRNIGASSHRKWGILKSAYLITEVVENCVEVIDFYKIIQKNEYLRAEYIDRIVYLICRLHDNQIIHGDLKLSNFYIKKCSEGKYDFGFWDLDGTKFYSSPLTVQQRRNELARAVASYIELGLRIDLKVDENAVTKLFLNKYSEYTNVDLSGSEIEEIISTYVEKSHRRIKKYGKKQN